MDRVAQGARLLGRRGVGFLPPGRFRLPLVTGGTELLLGLRKEMVFRGGMPLVAPLAGTVTVREEPLP